MNQISKIIQTTLLLFIMTSMSTAAQAEPVIVTDGEGTIIGVYGIQVPGYGEYNMVFNNTWQQDSYDGAFVAATGDVVFPLFTGDGAFQGSSIDLLTQAVRGCPLVPEICVGLTVTAQSSDGSFSGGAFTNYGTDDGLDKLELLTGITDAQDDLGTYVTWTAVSVVTPPVVEPEVEVEPVTISPALAIHIPSTNFNGIDVWVDLEYKGVDADGDNVWKLGGAGAN